MKIVKEPGCIPDQGAIHNVSCRNCGCKYSALTRDMEKLYNYAHFWKLIYQCPHCYDLNEITVDKNNREWAKGIDTDVKVEKKNYGGTF